jgi:septal ring factor EnvC (AmiA/AmiB activator)
MLRASLFAFVLFVGQAAGAQTAIETAREAAEMLRVAALSLSEARQLDERAKALTETIHAYEDGLSAMRDGLRRVAIHEKALALEFNANRENLSRLLGVLQSIERAPGPLLMIHPGGALGTARSATMLDDVNRALLFQSQDLRFQLEDLAEIKSIQDAARENLEAGLSGARDARVELASAISNRTHLPPRFGIDAETIASIVQSSNSLDGFAAGLAAVDPVQLPVVQNFRSNKGQIPSPVSGVVLRRFNEADAAGVRRPGVVVAAPALSLVTNPAAASVRYVGPLLDYGIVIILEPEIGVLVVLAGLKRVYVETGEVLPRGEPLGLLDGEEPLAADFLDQSVVSGGTKVLETLYIELRIDGAPTDPSDWFELK